MTEPDLHPAAVRVEKALNALLFGQEELIRDFLTGVFAGGHILLEGLPGLGKTRLARAFSALCGLTVRRIQFTPDLMPLDITGSDLLRDHDGMKSFEFAPGPLFANFVIADEINRASPKTQAALLEAMQEGQATVLGRTHPLPVPFTVLATQNPVEQEGTYPLPEAQLDRFMFKLLVPEVPAAVLAQIALGGGRDPLPEPLLTQEEFIALRAEVQAVTVAPAVADYMARLTAAARPLPAGAPLPADAEKNAPGRWLKYGVGPRAVLALAASSQARAFLAGRSTVGFEDVQAVAAPVLRHRLLLDYAARLDGVDAETVVRALLAATPVLRDSEPRSLAAKIARGQEDAV